MKFEKINIGAFGKLSDKEYTFSDGINIVCGNNEAGKSTLSSFMKYMLYGFGGSKTRAVASNDKLKYMPWNGEAVSGTADVTSERGTFHIQRTAGAKSTLKVFGGGKECLFGKEPGEELMGVDEQAFSKMAYIGQANVAADGMNDLSDIIQNIVFAADETVDIEKARKKLTDYRNFFRTTRKTGKCLELETKIRELKYAFDENSERHKALLSSEAKLAETRRKIQSNAAKALELKAELENIEGYEAKQLLDKILAAKQAHDAAEQALIAAKEAMTFDGALCTADKISDLSACYEKYLLCKEQYVQSKNALETARAKNKTEEDTDEMLKKCSGKPDEELLTLAEKASAIQSSRRTSAIFALLFLLLAAACGVLYFTKAVNEFAPGVSLPALTLPVAGAVFVGLFAVCAAITFSRRGKMAELLESYEFKNVKELFEFAQKLPDARRELIEFAAKEKVLGTDADTKKAAFADAERELSAKLSQFGADVTAAPVLITRLKNGHNTLDAAAHEYKRCESAYEAYLAANDLHSLDEKAQQYKNIPERDKKTVQREYEFVIRANENLAELEKQHIKQAAAPASTVRKPSEILAEKQALEAQLAECTEKANAAEFALQALEGACEDLKGGISPLIEKKAGELFAAFTGGKYSGLEISREAGLYVVDRGMLRDIAYLSTGTKDAAYLAMRVALCETLFREKPVLIFDEVFAYFDNDRLCAALSALKELAKEYQIFVFTCHEREKQLVGTANAAVIEME